MNANKLWAPWRIGYIQKKKEKGCVFCKSAKSGGFVVHKTKYSFSLLNIYPYNNGHLMVAPLRHVRGLEQLKDFELFDLIKNVRINKEILDKTLNPEGYNIGINLSDVAGAGVPGHLHIHIVPRWKGDTNFMPAISGTKVISQSLEELYKLLKNAQKKLG